MSVIELFSRANKILVVVLKRETKLSSDMKLETMQGCVNLATSDHEHVRNADI